MRLILPVLIFIFAMAFNTEAFAQSSAGNNALQIGLAYSGGTQADLNSWATSVGASSSQLTNGLEYTLSYEHRFASTMYSLIFRPAYFTESGSGGGANTTMTGLNYFQILRIYPLENSFLHFFLQGGIGWGSLSGTTTLNGGSVTYNGSNFGALAGMGSQFCFTDHQCATIELNARYLALDRSLVTSSSGSVSGLTNVSGHELEYNGLDVGNTLSGIQVLAAYTLKF